MQTSSQLKSTFKFFTKLLYCYKCILLFLQLKLIVQLLKTALLATFFTIFIGKLLDDNGKVMLTRTSSGVSKLLDDDSKVMLAVTSSGSKYSNLSGFFAHKTLLFKKRKGYSGIECYITLSTLVSFKK